jgi:hypothetical protein
VTCWDFVSEFAVRETVKGPRSPRQAGLGACDDFHFEKTNLALRNLHVKKNIKKQSFTYCIWIELTANRRGPLRSAEPFELPENVAHRPSVLWQNGVSNEVSGSELEKLSV